MHSQQNPFSQTVHQQRLIMGLRITNVATHCGVPVTDVVNWERGRVIPDSAKTIRALAQLLHYPEDALLWKARISHV